MIQIAGDDHEHEIFCARHAVTPDHFGNQGDGCLKALGRVAVMAIYAGLVHSEQIRSDLLASEAWGVAQYQQR
jgi:hypothetical protein